MKAVLVWKDGRVEPTDVGGGNRIIKPWHKDRRDYQTTFHVSHEGADGAWQYLEGETEDTTVRMAEAAQRIEERRWEVFRRGLDMDDEVTALREVADAAKNVVSSWRGAISRQPHIGRLKEALAKLHRSTSARKL